MPPIEDLSTSAAMDALNGVSDEAPDALPEGTADTLIDGKKPPKKKEDEVADDADAGADLEVEDEDNVDADSSDADDEGEEDSEGATDDAEEEGDEAEQTESAIEPPVNLDETEREVFKKLPKEAQEILARQSKLVTATLTQKTQAIAEKAKAYEARLEKLGEVKTHLEKRVEKWNQVDWAKQAQLLSEEEYDKARADMKKDVDALAKVKTDAEEGEKTRYEEHLANEFEELKKYPHLQGAAGTPGAKAREEIMQVALADGYTRETLRWMSAKEMNHLYNSIQWQKYQAEKAKKPPITAKKNEQASGRKTIKPASRSNPPTGVKGVVAKTFSKKPSAHNAMAALNAMDDD